MCDTKSSMRSLQAATASDGDAALKEAGQVTQIQDCEVVIKRTAGGFWIVICEVTE